MKILKSDIAIGVYQLVGIFAIAPVMIFTSYLA
jgi:hypothetical protein